MFWKRRKAPDVPKPVKAPDPTGPLDLVDPSFLAAPEETYARLRDNQPVCPLQRGGVLLTRHADVAHVLASRDFGNTPSRFSALHPSKADRHVAGDVAAHCLPFLDKDAHAPLRAAVMRAFHRRFAAFKPVLEPSAARHVEGLAGKTLDLVTGPARDFSCRTIADFVGLDAKPNAVKAITAAFFRLFAPVRDAEDFALTNQRLADARTTLAAALDMRVRDQRPCFLLELLEEVERTPGLTRQHVIDNAMLILADGVENIEAAIGEVMWHLSKTGGTEVSEARTREILRLNTPAQVVPRICQSAVQMHGETLAPGSPVFVALGAANRDSRAMDAPDALDPQRRPRDALTFGRGPHACIGEPLALSMVTGYCQALLRSGASVNADNAHFEGVFGHRWVRGLQVSLPPLA